MSLSCQDILKNIHEYLDGELSPIQAAEFEAHLGQCDECRVEVEDLSWVRQTLAVKEHLPAAAEAHIWKAVHQKIGVVWYDWAYGLYDGVKTYWRDLDGITVWTRVSAVPVTLAFFVVIMLQFPLVVMEEWTYPAFTMKRMPSSVFSEALITQIQARHTPAEIDGIMNAAGKLPYEDSFTVLAQVTAEGHAEIEDVIEYPKSHSLLQAVDDTLRSSEFQTAHNTAKPLVIYSFQKIDVYSDQPGL